MMKASELDGDVGDLARIGGKVPVVGLAISAAGVGWDIANGKPAGKAVFSGAIGTGAAFGVDALAGAGIEALGAGVLVTAAGPVVLGIAAGIGFGLAADYAWDHWVPAGVKDKIDDGLTTAGHDIGGAAKSVGHFFGSIF